MTDSPPPRRAHPIAIFLPVALLSAAGYAIIPAVLAIALGFGAGPAQAGLVTTMAAAGQVLAAVPSGQLVGRFGVRLSLPVSAAVILFGLVVLLLASNVFVLGAGVLLVGIGSSAHTISRIAAVAADVPRADRPQAFAHLSIAIRVGAVAGPLLGALAFAVLGEAKAPVFVAAALGAVALTIHLSARMPAGEGQAAPGRAPLWPAVKRNRGMLGHVTGIAMAVAGLRHIRIVLIPLVALSLGLNLGQVSLLLSVAAVVGVAAMYGGVRISRAYGWFFSGLASNVGIALGLGALVFAQGPITLICAVIVLEVSNGLGAGFMSTLFAEAAPEDNPAPIMGVFNLITESVSVAAPAAVMGVVAITALPVGVAVGAVFGVAGSVCGCGSAAGTCRRP
jgi:MFS family permease